MNNFDDVQQIRDLIERWAVYRDAFLWDKLRPIWTDDGKMNATWSEGTADEFIERNKKGLKNGLDVYILHTLGGIAVEVEGDRAVSMAKVLIHQRAIIDGVLCDVLCNARHYDLWQKANKQWKLASRNAILDKDRLDPVIPGETIALDQEILNRFPMEYQHLAYMQTKLGYPVNPDCARLSGGKALEKLYARGEAWLAGE